MTKTERISLGEEGLGTFLSGTERRIMEYLWSRASPATSTEIGAALGGMKISTVGAILDRLVASGFVKRTLDTSGPRLHYLYFAAATREQLARSMVDRVADAMVRSFGPIAVQSFSRYVPEREDKKEGGV